MAHSATPSPLRKLVRDAALATGLVIALVWLLRRVPLNFSVFEPVQEVLADFSITDLYYTNLRAQQAAAPQAAIVNDSIVLVNIGGRDLRSRSALAAVVRAVSACQPRVIGLDAYFLPRADSANLTLAAALRAAPQLVLGAALPAGGHRPRPGPTQAELRDMPHGFLNFSGDEATNATVRHFRPFLQAADTVYLSWSAELVKRFDTAAYGALCRRHSFGKSEHEEIRYQGNVQNFLHLEAAELLAGSAGPTPDVREQLRGKLVLLGAMGEQASRLNPADSYEDRHFTPLNERRIGRTQPDMYGVVIEANIISMLLRQQYINPTPAPLEWGLAAGLCFGLIAGFSYVAERYPRWYIPINQGVQFLVGLGLVYLVAVVLYGYYSRTFDLTLSLVALGLMGSAVAWYEALRDTSRNAWHGVRRHRYSRLLHRKLTRHGQPSPSSITPNAAPAHEAIPPV